MRRCLSVLSACTEYTVFQDPDPLGDWIGNDNLWFSFSILKLKIIFSYCDF